VAQDNALGCFAARTPQGAHPLDMTPDPAADLSLALWLHLTGVLLEQH
jgi:hypothetical protein